jgi:3-hydroxybutyryl-CoA dehydrogenase
MIGIVGGGQMGAGIAEVCATHGIDALVVEQSTEAAAAATGRIERSLARAVKSGKATQEAADAALARIAVSTQWDGLAGAEFIIEAVSENPALKAEVFSRLSSITAGSGTILATNTSSIPIAQIAAHTSCPERVIGLHFFNPVPVMPLVEVVPSILTSPETVAATLALAGERLDRVIVRTTDRAGFIVNTLLMPYLMSAIRMLEAGYATAEDIDTSMVTGCAHPMGPLALADFIGLDTCAAIADSMYGEFKEPTFTPPPLLRRMVESGLLGRKSGRGFYTY